MSSVISTTQNIVTMFLQLVVAAVIQSLGLGRMGVARGIIGMNPGA